MSKTAPTKKDNTGDDLSDQDFSGLDLSGYIFASCKLTGTNFSKCTFNAETVFTGAIFGQSTTNKVTNFSGCDLSNVKFSTPAEFGKKANKKNPVNLTKATIPWALLGSKFQFIDLSGAVIKNMPEKLNQCNLEGVKWNNFDFAGRSLFNSHFKGCDFTGCKMSGSNLDYVSFISACNLTGVKMNNCSIVNTIFTGSNMTDTDLSYASSFRTCSFLNTYLNGTIFDGNDLKDSKFGIPNRMSTSPDHITSFQFAHITTEFLIKNIQKNWQSIDFRNVIIEDFDSIKGDLNNLQAKHSLFNNSINFKDAKLNGADFTGATFNAINFNYAQLNNVTFAKAKTAQGKQAGYRGVRFGIPETETTNYNAFFTALNKSTVEPLIGIFKRFNIQLGNIACVALDKSDKNTEWQISDSNTVHANQFLVVKTPLAGTTNKFQLLVYENSPTTFSYAHLIGCSMQECDFSNVDMKHVQLYGALIISANLSNADLTGAQLGNNADIFAVTKDDKKLPPEYSYEAFLAALKNSSIDTLIAIFSYNGFMIGNVTCTPVVNPEGKQDSWQITDTGVDPPVIFSVKLTVLDPAKGSNELKVSCESYSPATLDNSYMPGITLTQADLTACSAQGCHLYNNEQTRSKATLNQTVLLDINFDGSNLYKADFTQAILAGASFTKANLMGASFKGVAIEQSSSKRNVTFKDTNLQGTDFSLANIKSVNFLDAAICIPISDQKKDKTYGVSLTRVFKADASFDQCLSDLQTAATISLVNTPYYWANALNPGKLDKETREAFADIKVKLSSVATISVQSNEQTYSIVNDGQEYQLIPGFDTGSTVVFNVFKKGAKIPYCNLPYSTEIPTGIITKELADSLFIDSNKKLKLDAGAKADRYLRPVLWSITDGDKIYTVWWGVAPYIEDGTIALNIRPSYSCLTAIFKSFQIEMRTQSVITKMDNVPSGEEIWELDMGSYDAFYKATGYIKFKIVRAKTSNSEALNFYGYTMRMMGLGNNKRQIIQDFNCEVTKLSQDIMDDSTIFPNKYTKSQNKKNNIPFEQWMWAKNNSPSPPKCVPTPYSYCPTS